MKKRNLIALAALPLALSLGGCALFKPRIAQFDKVRAITPQSGMADASNPMATGRKMLAAGNYGSAIGAFRLALFQTPDSAAAANGLAIAYDGIGRPDLAQRYFEQAMGSAPENESYRRNYQRFAEANDARATRLAAAPRSGPKTVPTKAEGSEPDRKLVRLSLGEVKLRTGGEPRKADVQAPPAEIRLATTGSKPMLTTPIIERRQEKKTVMASLSDLAHAVMAARQRASLKAPIIDRTNGCAAAGTEAQCVS